MTTLDDKLLGEKLQYYYSSSEEDEEDDEDSEKEDKEQEGPRCALRQEMALSSDGSAVNTGPKGVIHDWRRFKQLETERREDQAREMKRLVQRLSLSCRSHLDEEEDRRRQAELREKLGSKLTLQKRGLEEAEDDDDDDDEAFLQQYRQQRMEEMRRQLYGAGAPQQFRRVFELTSGEAFLEAVDGGPRGALVLVHLYEEGVPGAEALDGCLACLAGQYPGVKFCRDAAPWWGPAPRFAAAALPALLVYKGGELVGNFVRITDQLGLDFFADDLESFLQECGLLPEKEAPVPGGGDDADDDGSDLDID
nr:PREDICTED: phosducin-like protein [Anolis carolinensis]|eukprot:XP_003230293.1 PREDICTED: phosducin-like protein [Anolis carolinensis]